MDIPRPLLTSLGLWMYGGVSIWPVTEENGHPCLHRGIFLYSFIRPSCYSHITCLVYRLVLAIDISEIDNPFHEPQTFSAQYSFTTGLTFLCGVQTGMVGGREEWRNLETEILNLLRRYQQGSPTTYEYDVSHFEVGIGCPNAFCLTLFTRLSESPFNSLQLMPQFTPLYRRMKNNWFTRMLVN